MILAPLGAAATLSIVVALAYLALAWLGYLVFLLGTRWFSWPVGLAAAALVLSRYEVLSYGVRAYVDIPYVVLVLAALAVESRRRRAGWPVARAARRWPACCGPRPGSSPASTGCSCWPALDRRASASRWRRWSRSRRCCGCSSTTCDHRQRAVVADQHAPHRRASCTARRASPTSPTTGRGGSARCSAPTASSPAAIGGVLALWLTRSRGAARRGRRRARGRSRSRSSPPPGCRSRTATSS